VEGGGEVCGEVGDGVEDESDVWHWNGVGGGASVATRSKFVLVMEFVQVGAVFKLGFQVGVVRLGCSSRGVQVGVL
jgi:hypothetical protein